MFIVKDDYAEPYTDGSGRYKTLFHAGQAIPWATAYAVGLVTTKTEPTPKVEEKPEAKAKPEKAQKEETQAGD